MPTFYIFEDTLKLSTRKTFEKKIKSSRKHVQTFCKFPEDWWKFSWTFPSFSSYKSRVMRESRAEKWGAGTKIDDESSLEIVYKSRLAARGSFNSLCWFLGESRNYKWCSESKYGKSMSWDEVRSSATFHISALPVLCSISLTFRCFNKTWKFSVFFSRFIDPKVSEILLIVLNLTLTNLNVFPCFSFPLKWNIQNITKHCQNNDNKSIANRCLWVKHWRKATKHQRNKSLKITKLSTWSDFERFDKKFN